MFAQLLLAGLDVGRLHWSAKVPFQLQILGLVGFAMGMGLTTWAMLANRFFSSAVRLQPDRGQHVVTSGPYGVVRHPGYSGGLLLLLSIGLALGSWIAIVPILLIVPFMVRRTLIEERMLATALPGDADYMQRSGRGSFRVCGERRETLVSASKWPRCRSHTLRQVVASLAPQVRIAEGVERRSRQRTQSTCLGLINPSTDN